MGGPRTFEEILQGESPENSLEEFRFWEEYFFYNETRNLSSGLESESTLDTTLLLRQATGYSSIAVRNSTLLVCTLSCGPFIYNKNIYEPIDRVLLTYTRTLYELALDSTVFLWVLCAILAMLNLFKLNKLSALQLVHSQKEIALRNMVSSLETKLRNAKKRLDKLKQS